MHRCRSTNYQFSHYDHPYAEHNRELMQQDGWKTQDGALCSPLFLFYSINFYLPHNKINICIHAGRQSINFHIMIIHTIENLRNRMAGRLRTAEWRKNVMVDSAFPFLHNIFSSLCHLLSLTKLIVFAIKHKEVDSKFQLTTVKGSTLCILHNKTNLIIIKTCTIKWLLKSPHELKNITYFPLFFLDKCNIEDIKQWRQCRWTGTRTYAQGLKHLRKTAWEISCIELRRFPLSVSIYCSFQYNSENNIFLALV